MSEPVSRAAARALVVDPDGCVLLLRADVPDDRLHVWLLPGGGCEAGETFAQACRRELREETGIEGEPSHLLWLRRCQVTWGATRYDLTEHIFVVDVDERPHLSLDGVAQDPATVEARWVAPHEIAGLPGVTAPRALASLLAEWLAAGRPATSREVGL